MRKNMGIRDGEEGWGRSGAECFVGVVSRRPRRLPGVPGPGEKAPDAFRRDRSVPAAPAARTDGGDGFFGMFI